MEIKKGMLVVVSWMFVATAVLAANFGDPAAPLQVGQWMNGGPVDLAAGNGKTVSTLQDDYFEAAYLRSGQAEASEIGERILSEEGDDAGGLHYFAWRILTDETLYDRDYTLALRAARQAVEKSDGRDFYLLETYARALFMTGQTNDAIVIQQKAIKFCDDSFLRLKLKETLEGFQHPVNLDGIDDTKCFEQFVDGAVALIKAKQAVSLDKLLSRTGIQPCLVPLTKVSAQPVSSETLYEQARQSVLIVGTLTDIEDGGELEPAVASGFVIHESGIFVTNFHVLDQPDGVILAAMTADGQVYPVKRILAVAPSPDIAICQLDGATGLKPLAIVPNAKPGARIRVLSHPDTSFYSMTDGILSRYFVYREEGTAVTMFSTTADFAGGSSGGPIFDECGNVIGMVSATRSVYSGPDDDRSEEAKTDSEDSWDDLGDLQMIIKMCVPSSDILKLVTGESTGRTEDQKRQKR